MAAGDDQGYEHGFAREINYISLRYFNVAGADRDGRIGEGKKTPPTSSPWLPGRQRVRDLI
ncbi:hypothetical protein [Neomoorella thermoacetica]|uniref:hypothetical protein n=1 Tax=Neomoorella thermoacetica TaxID=1525 RepID=UPI000B333D85|nr:hypothetical protein [Moorella thermoacetica]